MEAAHDIFIAVFVCIYVAGFAYFTIRQWPTRARPEEGWRDVWHTFGESALTWLGTPFLIAVVVGGLGLLFGWF